MIGEVAADKDPPEVGSGPGGGEAECDGGRGGEARQATKRAVGAAPTIRRAICIHKIGEDAIQMAWSGFSFFQAYDGPNHSARRGLDLHPPAIQLSKHCRLVVRANGAIPGPFRRGRRHRFVHVCLKDEVYAGFQTPNMREVQGNWCEGRHAMLLTRFHLTCRRARRGGQRLRPVTWAVTWGTAMNAGAAGFPAPRRRGRCL